MQIGDAHWNLHKDYFGDLEKGSSKSKRAWKSKADGNYLNKTPFYQCMVKKAGGVDM